MKQGNPTWSSVLVLVLLSSLLVSGLSSSHPFGGARPAEVESPRVPLAAPCPGGTSLPPPGTPACRPAGPSSTERALNSTPNLAWSEPLPLGPDNASRSALAADASRAEAVQFGGETGRGLTNLTQEYNESTNRWTVLHYGPSFSSTANPSPRAGFAFAGDPTHGTAVLFGGETNLTDGRSSNDTWVFNFADGTWTNRTGPSGPAPRQDAAFAIDPALGIAVLFGGWDQDFQGAGEVTYSDTWQLNLTNDLWSRVFVGGVAPPALYGARLTWDGLSATFDLFGGCYPCSARLWQFDPTSELWTVVAAGGTPPGPRMLASWTYAPLLASDVLFGGTDGDAVFGDTLLFSPTTRIWTAAPVTGALTVRYSSASDWLNVSDNATLLLTGGTSGSQTFNDTWRLSETLTLTVHVVNATTLLPIAGASVVSGIRATLYTGVDGNVTFSNVPSGEVALTVSANGYAPNSTSLWPAPGQATNVVVALDGVAVEGIHAHVLNSTTTPAVGATVNLTASGTTFLSGPVTDAEGWVNLTDVPAFDGFVTAWEPGTHTATQVVGFLPGQVITVELTLVPLARVHAVVTGLLPNGTVAPLGNATVRLGPALLGLTDPAGELNGTTASFGPQTVNASAPYFRSNFTGIDVPVTGPVAAPIQLVSAPAGSVDLTLLNAVTFELVPLVEINFSAVPPDTVPPAAFSNMTVRGVLFTSMLPGNYTLTAWADGFEENESLPVQWIQPDRVDQLTVLLTPAPKSALDVIVLDAGTHDPIGGAAVTLLGVTTVLTDAAGWANVTGLTGGTYEILASAAGYNSNETTAGLAAGQVISRFPINLSRAVGGASPGGQNGLAILPPDAVALWPLLLLPLAGLAFALVYLTILRAPESPPLPKPVTAPPRRPKRFGRRRPPPDRPGGGP